jgi:hypothetical protein
MFATLNQRMRALAGATSRPSLMLVDGSNNWFGSISLSFLFGICQRTLDRKHHSKTLDLHGVTGVTLSRKCRRSFIE